MTFRKLKNIHILKYYLKNPNMIKFTELLKNNNISMIKKLKNSLSDKLSMLLVASGSNEYLS